MNRSILTGAIAAVALCSIYLVGSANAQGRIFSMFDNPSGPNRYDNSRWEMVLKDAGKKSSFFKDAAKFSRNKHCDPQFAVKLGVNSRKLSSGPDTDWLISTLKKNVMDNCGREFESKARSFVPVARDPDLQNLTEGFVASSPNSFDDKLARAVAAFVGKFSDCRVKSEGKFSSCFARRSPCKKFKSKLDYPYTKFLKLAAEPDFYHLTSFSHVNYVNMLAACNHIESSSSIISNAYRNYRSW